MDEIIEHGLGVPFGYSEEVMGFIWNGRESLDEFIYKRQLEWKYFDPGTKTNTRLSRPTFLLGRMNNHKILLGKLNSLRIL